MYRLICFVALVALASCATLEVRLEGVEPLAGSFFYEGWLIGGANGPLSTGELDVSSSLVATQTVDVTDDVLERYTGYLITIEPDDNDPSPAATRFAGGDFNGAQASIDPFFSMALNTDFSDATARFILAAPSNPDGPQEYGVWWIDNTGTSLAPGLDIPLLPSGWTYEGWVVFDGEPISTGTFLTANQADSDGAGATAGPEPTPPFPGQDFVVPPRSLLDADNVVISVEPVPDDSPAPFAFKPFTQMTIAEIFTPQSMVRSLSSFATGSATVRFETGSTNTVSTSTATIEFDSSSSSASSTVSSILLVSFSVLFATVF